MRMIMMKQIVKISSMLLLVVIAYWALLISLIIHFSGLNLAMATMVAIVSTGALVWLLIRG